MGGGKEWWFIRIKEKLSNYFLIKKQQIIQRLYWHFPFLFYLISFQSIKLIILIIFIVIIFIFKIIGDEKEILRIYGDTKYLTISLETSADKCGGLGNMMWRTASLYVIGKQLNRSIYFDGNYKCIYEYKEEFRDIFENNYKIFKIMRPKKQHVKLVSFAEKCCHYDSPDRLTDESAQLIKIWGNYLQSFKYLRNYKKQIRKFFTFSTQNKLKAYQFAQKLFKSQSIINKEFRICVHTRRGDFVELQQSTNKYFTEKATSYIINSVRKRYLNVSIILFGDDNNFLNHIEIADNVTIYTPTIRSRAVNLCFAINYCNSLLITAPTSTFAWWMGYLLPEGSPIFYYSCERSCRHISKKDFFPTEWLPLTLNFEGKIEVDDNPF